MLRTACRRATTLPSHITIAVNASPLQLRQPAFLGAVSHALSSTGLAPKRLEIEITEGVLLQHTSGLLSILHELHAMGVRLAMDDFGTGYSSLGQLAKLPFNVIKIDRSLVGAGAAQRAIVRSIVTLGGGLGMSTLAEGLETEEDFRNASSAGCISGQGYLFGRAMPAGDLDDVVRQLSAQAPTPARSRLALARFALPGNVSAITNRQAAPHTRGRGALVPD